MPLLSSGDDPGDSFMVGIQRADIFSSELLGGLRQTGNLRLNAWPEIVCQAEGDPKEDSIRFPKNSYILVQLREEQLFVVTIRAVKGSAQV